MTWAGWRVSANEREAAEVAEHDGGLALDAAEAQTVGAPQHLLDHRLGDEARERLARVGALEGDGDAVDGGGQQQRERRRQ